MPFKNSPEQPGALHSIFETVLGVFLGVVAAVAFLALKPVAVADSTSELDPDANQAWHEVTYVKGREGRLSLLSWQANYRRFLDQAPEGVQLSEQDVNRWVGLAYGGKDRTIEWDDFGVEVKPGMPVFRFADDRTEIGVVYDLKALGKSWRFVLQAKGDFETTAEGVRFCPDEMYIGSFRIPRRIRQNVYDMLAGSYPAPEESKPVFAAIRDVRVAENKLKIGFPVRKIAKTEVSSPVEPEKVAVPGPDVAETEHGDVAEAEVKPADEAILLSDSVAETAGEAMGEEAAPVQEAAGETEEALADGQPVDVALTADDFTAGAPETDLASNQ